MAPKRARSSGSNSNEVNAFPSSHPRLAKKIYDASAAKKDVLVGKAFDLGVIRSYIPQYFEVFDAWGWSNLMLLKKSIMPEVVRHFYFFGEDKNYDSKGEVVGQRDFLELPTKLFNEHFIVTVDMINDCCEIMVRDGDSALPKMNHAQKLDCVKTVFKKEGLVDFPFHLVKVSNLDAPERLLHYVIAQFVFARKRASEITDLDLFCMARIMRREPFNLGAFVLGKMFGACVLLRAEKGFNCPFGKIITLICEMKFGEARLANMVKVEEIQKGSFEDNIKLMDLDKVNGVLVSPGYLELDNALREAFRGGGVLKRKKGQRSMKNLPGVLPFSSRVTRFEQEGGASGSRQVEDEVEEPQEDDETMSVASLVQILKRIETKVDSLGTRLEIVEQKVDALGANDSDEEVEDEDEEHFDMHDDMEP